MRSRHRRGWAGPAIALALVIGLVAGCGGSDQAGNTSDNANSAGGGSNGGGGSGGGGGGGVGGGGGGVRGA